jgi:hypothetical protein
MVIFLICLILNILISFGMAVAFVEKSDEWPMRNVRIRIQKIIHDHISWRFSRVLFCSTCSSFWFSGIVDVVLSLIAFFVFGQFYFLWPLAGFAAMGFTWFIIEFLNATDKEQNINIYTEDTKNQ